MHQPIINRQMLCDDIIQGKVPFRNLAGAKPYLFSKDVLAEFDHNTPSHG